MLNRCPLRMKFPIALGRWTIAVANCSHAKKNKSFGRRSQEKSDCQNPDVNLASSADELANRSNAPGCEQNYDCPANNIAKSGTRHVESERGQ